MHNKIVNLKNPWGISVSDEEKEWDAMRNQGSAIFFA
jgi:hypothetical protein